MLKGAHFPLRVSTHDTLPTSSNDNQVTFPLFRRSKLPRTLRIFSAVSTQRRSRRLLAIHRSSSGNYEYASRPGLPLRNRSTCFGAHIFPEAMVRGSSILPLSLPLSSQERKRRARDSGRLFRRPRIGTQLWP